VQPSQETVVAKRQISLWTDKEKGAFMEAYKVRRCLPVLLARRRSSCLSGSAREKERDL